MKNKVRTIINFAFSIVSMASLSSCSSESKNYISEDTKNVSAFDFFTKEMSDSELNIFFFDIDNINSGKETERTYKSDASTSVGSYDSYIVKIGNTEILVDCGYQTLNSGSYTKEEYPYKFTHQYLKENVEENVLPKLTSVCTDGILEYLIVTHSDFDHLSSLCVEGGVIDAFNNKKTVTNLGGASVTLKSINNVIDFNSGVLALHSYYKIDKEKRLCRALYQTYLAKIESLVKNGTNYLPAAALFDENLVAEDGTLMSLENKLLATPAAMRKNVDERFETTILSETRPNDAAYDYLNEVPKNRSYLNRVESLGGSLRIESDRYYYSIGLKNNAELRILYNWYYDFAYRQSFNDGNRGQPINNPSVCLEVVDRDFKFLTCGDAGGNAEDGLIEYYKDTSILKNVTVYKSSHHGSTTNNENSQNLFEAITPKVIVVTGCAQSPLEVKNVTAAYMKQSFFDNVYAGVHNSDGSLVNGLESEPYILCTNIDWCRLNESNGILINESKPFYGDIKINNTSNGPRVGYSYKGDIHAFVKTGSGGTIDFKTIKDNKILKVQETEWFKKVGFKYGGN